MTAKTTKAELWNLNVAQLIRITELETEVAMLRPLAAQAPHPPDCRAREGSGLNCTCGINVVLTATADSVAWLKEHDREVVLRFLDWHGDLTPNRCQELVARWQEEEPCQAM